MKVAPIGYIKAQAKYRYDSPRQGVLADNISTLELLPGSHFEQALIGLSGFSHLWLIFSFDQNTNWKPMVQPPRHSKNKVGVFATRSPHRPNHLGLSCVELVAVEGLKIHIRNSDLLDGTPVFDIKPYLAYCDSFPEATSGWIKEEELYSINYSTLFLSQQQWLLENANCDLRSFIQTQLEYEPENGARKRLQQSSTGGLMLCYRTWRIVFAVDQQKHQVNILEVVSGYSETELMDSQDPYNDKALHREYKKIFEDK